MRPHVIAGVMLAVLSGASAAQAGTAFYFSNNGPKDTQANPGLATVTYSDAHRYGTASAYEFVGGVGVSTFSSTTGVSTNSFVNMQTGSSASFADSFRVRADTPNLFEEAGGVYQLTVAIKATGTQQATGAQQGVNSYSTATADYKYAWNVTAPGHAASGSGGVDTRFFDDGSTQTTVLGDGAAGTFGTVIFVRLGDIVSLSLSAGSFSSADGVAPATGFADFGHTLRWGGITDVSFIPDGGGPSPELPDGFRLSLTSDSTGFDYWNAAGPNPYTTPAGVPEPSSWALALTGFLFAGSAIRRRKAALG